MAKTYTVKWGDTLWGIAQEHNTTYKTLAEINNLDIVKKNGQDYVYLTVGQVIKLVDDGSSSTAKKVTEEKVKIRTFGLQSNSDRGMYVTWVWDRANTKEYQVEWYDYYDGYWHKHESTVTTKNSEYTANNEASKVKVKIKPVSKTYTNSKNKEVAYWTNVSWVTSTTYSFSDNPPKKPSNAPSITIDGTKLSATLEGLSDLNSPSIIEFQLGKDEAVTSKTVKVSAIDKSTKRTLISVTGELTVTLGSSYRVRARTIRGLLSSGWSAWSEKKETVPATPEITKCIPGSGDNTVDVIWSSAATAKEYTIQYADNQSYFDNPTGDQPYSLSIPEGDARVKTCKAVVSEHITAEKNFYFRIQAKNTAGSSSWSNIAQYNSGKGPKAPMTSSLKSMYTVGELVTLQWTHQSNANPPVQAKYSHIDLYVDGVKRLIPTIDHGDEENNEKLYTLRTSATGSDDDDSTYDIICPDGAQLQWRVRTAGEDGYLGEWSALRTIQVYADPEFTFYAYTTNDTMLDNPFMLNNLPLKLSGFVDIESSRQYIIGYHIEIIADKDHQITDEYGDVTIVKAGDVIYARPFDIVDPGASNQFSVELSAGDVTFANDVSYTVTCTITMSSGLSKSQSLTFVPVIQPSSFILDAEVSIDPDYYTASIRPYCTQSDGKTPVENVLLHVYRREYDGRFTLISGDINNESNTFVTDPYPALDYARYRIVAVDLDTGTTIYSDIPAYPVGCKSIIIQWDEKWSNFDATDESSDEDTRTWYGEMLKFPYNIDITPKYSPDVALVKYIGRDHPVDYYGTQRGETSTWNTVIPKDDYETIYALRRLASYMGNVYVREPSGIGYRAHVVVNFGTKHRDLTTPVSFDITRVEGGE